MKKSEMKCRTMRCGSVCMKAQISVESALSLMMIFIAFSASLAVVYGQSANLFQMSDWFAAKYMAQKIAFAMNKVYAAGDGASLNLTLENVGPENITISQGHVLVTRSKSAASWQLLTTSVNTSTISGSQIRIRNNNGVLEIGGE